MIRINGETFRAGELVRVGLHRFLLSYKNSDILLSVLFPLDFSFLNIKERLSFFTFYISLIINACPNIQPCFSDYTAEFAA